MLVLIYKNNLDHLLIKTMYMFLVKLLKMQILLICSVN